MAFEEEIHSLVKAGIMDVEILFSRDECKPDFSGTQLVYIDEPGRKGYINKIIEEMQHQLAHMIRNEAAHLYICGRGALAKTAVEALEKTLCNVFRNDQGGGSY